MLEALIALSTLASVCTYWSVQALRAELEDYAVSTASTSTTATLMDSASGTTQSH